MPNKVLYAAKKKKKKKLGHRVKFDFGTITFNTVNVKMQEHGSYDQQKLEIRNTEYNFSFYFEIILDLKKTYQKNVELHMLFTQISLMLTSYITKEQLS